MSASPSNSRDLILVNLSYQADGTLIQMCVPLLGKDVPSDVLTLFNDDSRIKDSIKLCKKFTKNWEMKPGMRINGTITHIFEFEIEG